MKIEEEIQSKFENNFHKLIVNIVYTGNWANRLLKCNTERYGVTIQQYNILRILKGQFPEPATVTSIKERMLDKMSDASRLVERLCKKGLVERTESNQDRRSVNVAITTKGLELLASIEINRVIMDRLTENLSEREVDELNSLLDKTRG